MSTEKIKDIIRKAQKKGYLSDPFEVVKTARRLKDKSDKQLQQLEKAVDTASDKDD